MRATTKFVCQQCGFVSSQWMGKCPECGAWNSLVETVEERSAPIKSGSKVKEIAKAQKLSEIRGESAKYIATGFEEFDRVLGGGIVRGSVILLSGDPGIGKSTLLLELAINLCKKYDLLYVSGEESAQQIKLRGERLLKKSKQKGVNKLYVLADVALEGVIDTIAKLKPSFVVIDSIQTMESEDLTGIAGSVGQVRECAARLVRVAKEEGVAIFLIGHVTKTGVVAGPMVLSHMVDTVLFLEGERFKTLRILRSLKNRFGPVDEVGVFKIEQSGINEVKNPSELFLSEDGLVGASLKKKIAGSVAVATIEGTRPILVELQALVLPSQLAFPRRVVSGVDGRRVELLCAVLQKQAGLPLNHFDIFVNVAGGLKLSEPGIDLGICLAIASSFKNIPLPKTMAIGEVGLLGEIRRVSDSDKREKEGRKLGFTQIVSFPNYKSLSEVVQKLLTYDKNKKEN